MENKTEIAFFDVETTSPTPPGQGCAILEFGAILVCPNKLEELWSYSTLVRPSNPKLISSLSPRVNGIIPEAVVSAPPFADIADTVYDILHGRIWAGHNIVRFDCVRIREAFAEIRRTAPEPKGTIDTLALLTQKFGRRAATPFQESSLPDTFPENHWVSPNAITRSRIGKSPALNKDSPSSSSHIKSTPALSPKNDRAEETPSLLSPLTSSTVEKVPYSVASSTAHPDAFDMVPLGNEMNAASLQPGVVTMEENPILQPPEMPSTVTVPESCSDSLGFLEPDEVSLPSIRALHVPFFRGSQRIKLFYEGAILQLCCPRLRIRFGISKKFSDHAGRPRLSFVVDASPSLCNVLDKCDSIVQKVYADSGCSSDWRCVVSRRPGFINYPTVRLHIPTVVNGDVAQYATDMYQEEPSGTTQKIIFSKFDATELDTFFKPGTSVDSYFSLDPYDYQQRSGIRLVAIKLIIHTA
ncbi:hypothetical protein SADUNF_Sadunf15G0055000 [Salix dunnii]|uniref:Exonuclease domain-containing protein n=1 Tax=Salix dunnii TaxID=1413687 RepID=A0A835JE47_9ROSI|nr:hypothetical protein SADUNF_Sadunf15G0055000 [Salix dunnii]